MIPRKYIEEFLQYLKYTTTDQAATQEVDQIKIQDNGPIPSLNQLPHRLDYDLTQGYQSYQTVL